ncbi:replication initiation factor domain-containing protein [Shewanella sp. HL-SH4]|uniref:replication initiation factor domain-containing protein n=2 Tax=Shewanella sp. HL-SH4 TaxID=3436240 RepID=UPI003EC0D837
MQATNLLSRFWLTDRFGNVCQSRPVNNNDIVFKREKTPLLPCFRDKSISFAERLGQVGFDHLAFSVPFRSFQRLDCSAWAKLPDYSTYPDTQDGLDLFHEHVKETEQLRVEEFVIRVLGLRLGSTRSYGRFFYTHSKEILDAKRKKVIGFVAFGGNNDTVYFQISGTGCKHLFSHTNGHRLHHWLKFMGVTHLKRCDLFFDDFDGNFDCEYAIKAYKDEAFKRFKGGCNPKKIKIEKDYDGDQVTGEIVRIGSRQSLTYWRIYNKAAEQGLKGQVWYRSEVELKDVSIDVLTSPAECFAGLCVFSQSMNLSDKYSTDLLFKAKKTAMLTLEAKTEWLRKMCGRAIYDLVEDWGLSAEETLIALVGNDPKHGGKLSAPSYYSELIRF